MKITVKEVSGAKFEVDGVSASTGVMELKGMIEKLKGWAPGSQKLVFSGKILADDKTLADYDWKDKEGAFIVVMISKKPAATQAAAAPMSTPAAVPKPAPAAAPIKPAAAAAAPSPSQPSPVAAPAPAMSSPLVKDSDVASLKEMGFPEDQVRAALAAAFGNTDRAVEYLMNGIPAGVETQSFVPSSPPVANTAGVSAAPSGQSGDFPLLRAQPLILNQLKVVSRDNPQALAQYIQQLKGTNPEIIDEINKNRPGFLQLMKEPIDESQMESDEDMMDLEGEGEGFEDPSEMMGRFLQEFQSMSQEERTHAAAAMGINPNEMQALVQMMGSLPPQALAQLMQGGMPGGPGGMGGGPPQQVIHLTQAEVDAVNRLQELGFSRQACLEAYLACDKNEELAANYLFSNPPQEDD